MDSDALRAFLADAHRNGYASDAADVTEEGAATVIEYGDGDWAYVDRYYGSRSFVGHEVVLREATPVWGMHYYGSPTGDAVDHEPVYEFLRDALGATSTEQPFRGPEHFEAEPFSYSTVVLGELAAFRGEETIERGDSTVYRGQFGGGVIE